MKPGLALVFALATALAPAAHAQTYRPPLPKSHRHPGLESSMPDADLPKFPMVDTALALGTAKENRVVDRRRRYEVFTVGDTLLFVVDRRTGKAREVRGLPFGWRPFSNLTWADSRTLMFDRWSSPHNGMHYAVDIESGKLVAALIFHDN